MRKEILLNDEWLFWRGDIEVPTPGIKGPIYCQSKTERKLDGPASYNYNDKINPFIEAGRMQECPCWQKVRLPHDYIVCQDLCEKENNALGYFKYQNAWYRKHFVLPENCEGKRIVLRFDGIAVHSTIYLNGCLMHHNFSAYNTFEVDISNNVYYDKENVIAVYVNTEEFEGWWYRGGGIYRDVHLTITEPLAIDLWGVYAPYTKISEEDWRIDYETTVVNDYYDDLEFKVKSVLIDADGKTVAEAEGDGSCAGRGKITVCYNTVIKNPVLWSCNNPNLYIVHTTLFKDGAAIDKNTTRIGFRTVEISVEKGLLINGEKTIIKGVCAHQDFGLTGLSVPDNIARYKISLIKEMGANGYRTAHYQQTESYMDALDEMGFIVMSEVRWFETTKESFEQIESLVKRDRNRPSVFFWSTSNEEFYHTTDVGKRLHRAIAAHIRKFDKIRAITAAVDRTPDKCTIYDDCEIVGINYNLDIYDIVHEIFPNKPIIASECCGVPSVRDWFFDADVYNTDRIQDFDENHTGVGCATTRSKTWAHLMERDYVLGCYQWVAVDHRGEAQWPMISSKSGAMDIFLQKKSAFYLNKALWTEEPLVHIVSHWNFCGMEGIERFVPVYTNCDEVELFLNGVSLGRQKIEKFGHGTWSVPFAAGELKAIGYRDGSEVCNDIRETTGRAVKLKLTMMTETFEPNNRDMALFVCECVDEEGRVVPDASEYVRFTTGKAAQVVATGSDNTDPNRVNLPCRKMYMGKILVGVVPKKGYDSYTLSAICDGCESAAIKIKM